MQYHKNPDFQQLIAQIEALLAAGDREKATAAILRLDDMAQVQGDYTAQAATAFYSGMVAFADGDLTASIALREKALAIGQAHDVPYYSMRAYNGLAAVYAEQGDYYAALGSYLNAYHITSTYRDFGYIGVVLNNIGNLFVWMDEYDIAAGYLTNAFDAYRETGAGERSQLVSIVRNLIETYSCAGEFTLAREWAAKEDWPFTAKEKITVDCMLLANSVQEHFEQGDIDETYDAIDRFLELAGQTDEFHYMFRSYLGAGRVSIELGDHDLATRALECLIELDKRASIDTFRYTFAELRVRYYRQFLKEEAASDLADLYYEPYFFQSLKTIAQLKRTYLSSLMMELEMDKAKFAGSSTFRKSFRLRKDLELDPLTNLLNRASAGRYVAERLENRKEDGRQAILLVSINDFKSLNDRYGHHFGDMLLLEAVDILTEGSASDNMVSRFGGGEFLVFRDHVTNLERICQRVQTDLEKGSKIALPDDAMGKVSFSVGVCFIQETIGYEEALNRAAQALATAGPNGYAVYGE